VTVGLSIFIGVMVMFVIQKRKILKLK
jgi:hypothetical protein